MQRLPGRRRRASSRCSCTSRCQRHPRRGRRCSGSRAAAGSRLRPGDLLLIFFIWYAVVRFALETLRTGNWTIGGIPTAQIVSRRPSRSGPLVVLARPAPAAGDRRADRRAAGTGRGRGRTPTRPTRTAAEAMPSTRAGRRADDGARPTAESPDAPTTGASLAPARPPSPRAPPSRLRPRSLAAAAAAAPARASTGWVARRSRGRPLLYRLLRLVARFVLFVLFRFRIRTSGQEHLPGPAATSWSGPPTAAGWTRSSSSTPCRSSRARGSSAAARRTFTARGGSG